MPQAMVLALIRRVLESLDEAHELGMVHRDIKPSNIILTHVDRYAPESLALKVVDYGVAKISDSWASARSLNGFTTTHNEPQATPAYAPPEQLRGARPHPSMDIYGLGVTALEALRGNHPYAGMAYDFMLSRILSPEPIERGSTSPVRQLIEVMTYKDPTRRPQNARLGTFIASQTNLR